MRHRLEAGATINVEAGAAGESDAGVKTRVSGQKAMGRSQDVIGPQPLMVIGAALFFMGVIGFLTRRNLIVMFLCTEVMFQGVLLNLVGMGVVHGNLQGQAFALFVLVIAAVEAGLGLAIVVLLFRRKGTLDADAWTAMSG